MSWIRGKGNKRTEGALIQFFKEQGIEGWRLHFKLPGKPDFTFRKELLTVFVDGCFWHGYPRCYRPEGKSEVLGSKDYPKPRSRPLSKQGTA